MFFFVAVMSGILGFHSDTMAADKTQHILPSGEVLFSHYCALCHGEKGDGSGRLAKVIVQPPPANLVESKRSKAYLIKIISQGGAALGRSEKMPAWFEELGEEGIKAVADHVYRLRPNAPSDAHQ